MTALGKRMMKLHPAKTKDDRFIDFVDAYYTPGDQCEIGKTGDIKMLSGFVGLKKGMTILSIHKLSDKVNFSSSRFQDLLGDVQNNFRDVCEQVCKKYTIQIKI